MASHVIPPNKRKKVMEKKKKILLLSDDLRLTSGIATVSRDLALGTSHVYDWVQIGAAINHPDKGKLMDVSEDARKHTGVDHANVRIYCHDSYGDPMILRHIMDIEKPDAIIHFTDPRFWGWLYNMEHEIRRSIPLMYLNIWDSTPTPMWNKEAYASCDLLMAISKQTYAINVDALHRGFEGQHEVVGLNGQSLIPPNFELSDKFR